MTYSQQVLKGPSNVDPTKCDDISRASAFHTRLSSHLHPRSSKENKALGKISYLIGWVQVIGFGAASRLRVVPLSLSSCA